eukprot:CAMPEP_0202481092 /NCGR_PEP_ID=MMETSP1361-20130828/824_1 /ASSEMBLY_ACC=CAM_ASM_000849 /TAXON_ID=210615 /ORGANISM="Staurosira complex sp., Strain CCMP2646" /LENGTH=126 /DNA_ID=CAMNT_0049108585 /DNA_START=279 /DNA_END=659 /DNA_ORIENTATION=-
MHTLYPPPKAPGDGSDDDNNVLSPELKRNFDTVRTLLAASDNQEELESMATKTAMQASEEIARLENGIAELEALLEAQEQDGNGVLPNGVAFPSLPAVVVVEDEDESKSTTATPTLKQEGIKGSNR